MSKVVVTSAILFALFAFSLPLLVFDTRTAKAWSSVEGHLTQDTTWTAADSPYRAVNDVIVDVGVLLKIDPGVEVQFSDNSSLIIEGSLHSVGSKSSMIRFTSTRMSPSSGVWKNIEFRGDQNESFLMEYSHVEYAAVGVKQAGDGRVSIINSRICNSLEAGIELWKGNISVEKSTLDLNGFGIRGEPYEASILDSVNISQNSIFGNEYGIRFGRVDVSNSMIEKNKIHSNRQQGIFFDQSRRITHLFIQQNDIHDNGGPGIDACFPWDAVPILNFSISDNDIYSNDYGVKLRLAAFSVTDVAVVGNVVSLNNKSGILVYRYGGSGSTKLRITNNCVKSNLENGIEVLGEWDEPSLVYVGIISNNSIIANGRGIFLRDGRVNIGYNLITNNDVGVEIHGLARVLYSDIYENTQGMIVEDGFIVNAEFNYWGHESGPYHPSLNPEGQGNPVIGNDADVDFIPFLIQKADPIIPEFLPSLILPILLATTLLLAIFHKTSRTSCKSKIES